MFGDVTHKDVWRLKGCQLVLYEETDSRDEADSVLLPADVPLRNGEGFQLPTMMGSYHGKEEGKLDCEMNERRLAEGGQKEDQTGGVEPKGDAMLGSDDSQEAAG